MLAIVLKRFDYNEFDQMVSVLTSQDGKIKLLAKGVKKITSKNSPFLEPFSLVDFDYINGKNFDYLQRLNGVDYFRNLRQSWSKSLVADFSCQFIDSILPINILNSEIFDFLLVWLKFIEKTDQINFNFLNYFGFKISQILGWQIKIGQCFQCQKELNSKSFFVVQDNGFICQNCAKKYSDKILLTRNELGYLQKPDLMLNLSKPLNNLSVVIHKHLEYYTNLKLPSWQYLNNFLIL